MKWVYEGIREATATRTHKIQRRRHRINNQLFDCVPVPGPVTFGLVHLHQRPDQINFQVAVWTIISIEEAHLPFLQSTIICSTGTYLKYGSALRFLPE